MLDKFNKKIFIVIIVLLITVLLLCMFDVRLKTVHYKVLTKKISSPIKIALITDLHSCKYGNSQKQLISAVEKENPDIILLGGDIFDDKITDENAEIFIKNISSKYPCYYVTGNHEYWSNRIDEMLEKLKSYNVKTLDGKTETIRIGNQEVSLSGIDDPDAENYTDKGEVFYSQLEEVKKNKNSDLFTVLLAHRPSYIESYLEYNFDLVLSGHAHGGQWRIPFLLNGLVAPDEGWFPKYAGGQYIFDNGQMIVSRGLARESTRVPRIFNRPELVIVEIIEKQ